MKNYYITFRSVTYAQRGEKALAAAGISCALMRTPRWMEEQGCGYALRLHTSDVFPAVDLLRQKQIPLRKIYAQRADGQMEEVTL